MNIIVCLKPIRHIYARTGSDPSVNYLTPEDVIYRVNPYDEAALSQALKVKDLNTTSQVTVLTLGPLFAETELNRSLALGVDNFIQIETGQASEQLEPRQKAGLLARAVREAGADLVFCGRESLDRRNGQVGAFLANFLGLPFISSILEVKMLKDAGRARATRKAGGGKREVYECDLPAVMSVDLGPNHPLLPTVQHKSRAGQLPVQKLNYADQIIQNKTSSVRVFPPNPRPKKVNAPESMLPSFKRIRKLLEGSQIEKKGTILTGNAESQAKAIISFLQEQGFLGAQKENKES